MPSSATLSARTTVPHGLKVVDDGIPGIRRMRRRGTFVYTDPAGKTVRAAPVLKRIRSLVIPPAWDSVWICPRPEGHIQATGRDALGRKQYRYHDGWVVCREEEKRRRLVDLAGTLPRIRRRIRRELKAPGLGRGKVLALMVRLLELTAIRPGHEEYAVRNGSFGLASMKDDHAVIKDGKLEFRFRGKSGKHHIVGVDDPLLCRLVVHCRRLPGRSLFQYRDDEGKAHRLRATELNAWLKEASGREITAKDLRTWSATLLAFSMLRRMEPFQSAAEAKRNVNEAVKRTAEQLGNTPAICRNSYISAAVVDTYLRGELGAVSAGKAAPGLKQDERALLALLLKGAAEG